MPISLLIGEDKCVLYADVVILKNSRRPGRHSQPHSHDHTQDHSHDHTHSQTHHYGQTESGLTVAGFSQERLIQIEKSILSKNDGYAVSNRQWLAAHDLTALNLLSSPAPGKRRCWSRPFANLGKGCQPESSRGSGNLERCRPYFAIGRAVRSRSIPEGLSSGCPHDRACAG